MILRGLLLGHTFAPFLFSAVCSYDFLFLEVSRLLVVGVAADVSTTCVSCATPVICALVVPDDCEGRCGSCLLSSIGWNASRGAGLDSQSVMSSFDKRKHDERDGENFDGGKIVAAVHGRDVAFSRRWGSKEEICLVRQHQGDKD